jgi:MtN3 and saliva related transmembrane protein
VLISSSAAIGFAAGVFTTAANFPQVLKTYREKSGKGLSFRMLLSLAIGLALWMTYGFMLLSFPIIIANAFSMILVVSLLIMKIRYDRHPTVD